MLEVRDLVVRAGGTEILSGVSLTVGPGELHVLMGPNGSGKSTLAATLMGHPDYERTGGEAALDGQSLFSLSPHERAHAGLFLSFQHPADVPGLELEPFLRLAVNKIRGARGAKTASVLTFHREFVQAAERLGLDPAIGRRGLNEGFSGGERKKVEILQLLLIEPRYAMIDECDSGLDVDAIRLIGIALDQYIANDRSVIMITHYPRMLEYLRPTHVHLMKAGRIVQSGSPSLIESVISQGFASVS